MGSSCAPVRCPGRGTVCGWPDQAIRPDPNQPARTSAHVPTTGSPLRPRDLSTELEVEARRRERWIRRRLSDEATVRGVLAAATTDEATLHLLSGERTSGRITSVGSDVVGIRSQRGVMLIHLAAIAVVEAPSTLPAAAPAAGGTSMLEVLYELLEHRTEAILSLVSEASVRGALLAVDELATVATDRGGGGRRRHHLRPGHLDHVRRDAALSTVGIRPRRACPVRHPARRRGIPD